MDFVYSPKYKADIGMHVFPTEKYALIHQTLQVEGLIKDDNVLTPARPGNEQLLKIITQEYLDDLLNLRSTARTFPSEMPVNKDIIDAQILCCGGSYLAAQRALESGACYHIGGGFHHAFPTHAVFTFSMHQEHLYPMKQKSDLDIGLDNGVGDEEYLEKLTAALKVIYGEFKPDFVIYLAGADPYVFDQLGSLKLTIEGLRKRDELVIHGAQQEKTPVAVVLGGGYAEDVNDTVEIHCNTARVLNNIVRW
jgi:acetoin utilization deacetylase AcuC-like enzyme